MKMPNEPTLRAALEKLLAYEIKKTIEFKADIVGKMLGADTDKDDPERPDSLDIVADILGIPRDNTCEIEDHEDPDSFCRDFIFDGMWDHFSEAGMDPLLAASGFLDWMVDQAEEIEREQERAFNKLN